MSIIFQKPYSYTLYDYGGVWYLTYLSGGSFETGVSIKLSADEMDLVRDSQEALEILIKNFKHAPSLYDGREITPIVTSKGPPE